MSANTRINPAPGMHRAADVVRGTRGLGSARVLCLAGVDVVLSDVDPDLTAAAQQRLRRRTVANQLPKARLLESVSRHEDGAATAEKIDQVVCTTFGFLRVPHDGPLEIAERELTYPAMSRFLQERSVRKDEQEARA
jgi:3-hydroxyacyl-CoA dehydrogenase